MVLTLEIATGKDASSRTIAVDTDDLTLGFQEDLQAAQASGKWTDLNAALAQFLGLTHAEVRALTLRQFREVAAALNAAAQGEALPNG